MAQSLESKAISIATIVRLHLGMQPDFFILFASPGRALSFMAGSRHIVKRADLFRQAPVPFRISRKGRVDV